jgi:predicted kinase
MEVAILIGLQAAGKTSFFRKHFADTHSHVSKDLLRNSSNRQARQMALIEQGLKIGKSVVVDNTNPRVQDRAPLIALGKTFGARIIGYTFEATVSECIRRNAHREGRARVPDVAIYATARKFERPIETEGFDMLFRVRLDDGGFEVEPEPVRPGDFLPQARMGQ